MIYLCYGTEEKRKTNMTQQEELAYLRTLVAKQKEQLAEQERIIEKQNRQIENMTQALLHARKKTVWQYK